jgi:hypothetical protein
MLGGEERNAMLIQQRFPIGWHPSCGPRRGLIFRMRVRRKQLHTFDHPLLLVVIEPIFAGFETRDDPMSGRCRML